MSTVILSSGSFIIVIIGVVVWVISVIMKYKKTAQTFTRVQPQDVDQSENDEETLAPSEDKRPLGKRKQDNNAMTFFDEGMRSNDEGENPGRMVAIDDVDLPKSEYSIENSEDAKRAIIYSEIFKPKF